jgi:chromosome segregation protein
MYLKSLELVGFKSFGKKSELEFSTAITAVVGPNGSGKSNCAEAFRFVLGEQSMKGLRSKRGEDLIWGGSSELPRSNRASVKATFNNTPVQGKRLFNIDFDEVSIERVVFRDGTNEYSINGSRVRLKDVQELLAGANVGASGHHIISQGEADRVLAASPKERKQMIDDALGLRIYQYKKDESLRKLEKTEENRAQVDALRKENAPHLKFLEKQMKKLERARELRSDLVQKYHEYLKREENYLTLERSDIEEGRKDPEHELSEVQGRIATLRTALEHAKKGDKESAELLDLEHKLSTLRAEHAEHARVMGRIEGQIAYEERRIAEEKKRAEHEEGAPVPYKEARSFWDELTRVLDTAVDGGDIEPLRHGLREAQKLLRHFIERHKAEGAEYEPDTKNLEHLETERANAEAQMTRISTLISEREANIRDLKNRIEQGKDQNREQERELFTLMAQETAVRATLKSLKDRETILMREEEEFKREIGEGIALIGRQVMGYKEFALTGPTLNLDTDTAEDRSAQLERRRELEKLKIRLEEMGGASADDITKEYTEVKERDDFLAKELTDLDASSEALRTLIEDLEHELNEKFSAGVSAISTQFNEYFALMFGGGNAKLKVVEQKKRTKLMTALFGDEETMSMEDGSEEDEEVESGVEVEVSLPRKRVQNLMMLSGGERALTSIALIFAMSQVNPPPFLILDETDAALDEANSRRYGDMIENLSKKSQLILITHNRETMSRAGVLYGITMGLDGVSKILSVRFEEAAAVAK